MVGQSFNRVESEPTHAKCPSVFLPSSDNDRGTSARIVENCRYPGCVSSRPHDQDDFRECRRHCW